jgi:hypothetical protein
MFSLHFLVTALCIYQCFAPASSFSLVPSKQYRIDRYSMYNCDKAHKNEYIIFNKATMRMSGGKDKLIFDGYFEILQDINEEIRVSLPKSSSFPDAVSILTQNRSRFKDMSAVAVRKILKNVVSSGGNTQCPACAVNPKRKSRSKSPICCTST